MEGRHLRRSPRTRSPRTHSPRTRSLRTRSPRSRRKCWGMVEGDEGAADARGDGRAGAPLLTRLQATRVGRKRSLGQPGKPGKHAKGCALCCPRRATPPPTCGRCLGAHAHEHQQHKEPQPQARGRHSEGCAQGVTGVGTPKGWAAGVPCTRIGESGAANTPLISPAWLSQSFGGDPGPARRRAALAGMPVHDTHPAGRSPVGRCRRRAVAQATSECASRATSVNDFAGQPAASFFAGVPFRFLSQILKVSDSSVPPPRAILGKAAERMGR